MFAFAAYEGLPAADQTLHGLHFMLCCFAVLIACLPLLTQKGSIEHKFGGTIYLPVSMAAFSLACVCAWREQSLVLFCFNGFCAYLMLSGWRALRAKEKPELIDWLIPASLFTLSAAVALHACMYDEGMQNFYLLFFAMNGFFLSWRDFKSLQHRNYWARHKKFMVDLSFGAGQSMDWLNRHIAGMVGSVMANMSVVVLTLLPLSLHWLWPATLVVLAVYIAMRNSAKKRRLHQAIPVDLRAKFAPKAVRKQPAKEDDLRRAA